ncbi:unnamed protein product [Periconia digitata]|uniref:Zn(2)-C6 fungal-type domain-containing protein n=1 Tax=Periconia digitata TaxID=1303443 RepID=A0A9W4XDG9_9PLEO|nr:unnamed protein product [Periconia digitata]
MTTATRKTHNKTRLGCANCKKRRIKCDCKHPICSNCEKRGHDCSFLLLAPSSQLSVKSVTSPRRTASPESLQQIDSAPHITSPSLRSPRPPSSGLPPHLRCDDVWRDAREKLSPSLQDLLYHFEYTTALTLASQDPAKEAWQIAVPQLAARHDFLTHHILAIASLHLGRLHVRGDERSAMMNLSASQMNKALSRYRPALENINAENASALFAGATLTAVYLFRQSTVEIDELRASISVKTKTSHTTAAVSKKMLESILRTIYGLRGPLAVLIPGFQYVLQGQMGPVLDRNWWPHPSTFPSTEQAIDEDRRLARIEELWTESKSETEPFSEALAAALLYLREAYALVSVLAQPDTEYPSHTSICYSYDSETETNLKDRGAIFFWATKIPREFLVLLEQKNRDALVIVAHYAVLPGRVRNTWWLEGLGSNMVIAVAMALGRDNWHLIEWPVKVLNVDLENAFTAKPDKLEGNLGEVPMEII